MTDMRERETLDWTKIVDGSREVDLPPTYRDADTIIKLAVDGYRRDYWQHQPVNIEVWSEKATVRGLLRPLLREFGVSFRNVKGFGSFTAVRRAIEEANTLLRATGKPTIVLYVGDWDPSGLWMSEKDLPGRIKRYAARNKAKRQISRAQGGAQDCASLPIQ
jgi:hypothetical protein